MKRSILFLFLITTIALLSSAALAQDMNERVYPFQYADLDAYTAATGNTIDNYGEAPMLAERVAAGDLPPVEDRVPAQPVGSAASRICRQLRRRIGCAIY